MNKEALKCIALKERIAEIVSAYEDNIADIRAEYTLTVEALNERISELEKQIEDSDVAVSE